MQFHMDEEEEDIMTHFSDSIHPVAVTRNCSLIGHGGMSLKAGRHSNEFCHGLALEEEVW
jgi:hypothetical protein